MGEAQSAFRFLDTGPLTDSELTLRLARTVARDATRRFVATYHFEMIVGSDIAGGIRFRAESAFDVETDAGHIGYNVDPGFRGQHLAERACRLLAPLAQAHGFASLWITCDPDNLASRRTCERLGAALVDIVTLPPLPGSPHTGERRKCRYLWDLGRGQESQARSIS